MSFPLLVLFLALGSSSLPDFLLAQSVIPARDLWCVAKNNADDQSLRAAIDWACGPGGADCGPIQDGGKCNDPSDIQSMATWAFNDYYLKHGLTDDACYFSNSAALTSLNPSHDNCKFPSSLSVNNGSSSSLGSTTLGPANNDWSSCNRIDDGTWFLPLFANFLFVLFMRAIQVH